MVAGTPLTVLISGASGFIGAELTAQLERDGHTVHRLVRRVPESSAEHAWDPANGELDPAILDRMDAVIGLSGAPTGRLPWTAKYQREILDSRIAATSTITRALGRAESPPGVFLSASGVGFYGDRPGEALTEQSAKGAGFLADVVESWEAASHAAPAGVRVANIRTGLVVGHGGAFTPLVPLTKLGLGARIGTGRQNWPWIGLFDEAAGIRHLLTSGISGPVNFAAPTPATADRVTGGLAKALHRWYPWVLPAPILTGLFRDAARELLLPSQLVVPTKLLADGFTFRHTDVESAIADEIVSRKA